MSQILASKGSTCIYNLSKSDRYADAANNTVTATVYTLANYQVTINDHSGPSVEHLKKITYTTIVLPMSRPVALYCKLHAYVISII